MRSLAIRFESEDGLLGSSYVHIAYCKHESQPMESDLS